MQHFLLGLIHFISEDINMVICLSCNDIEVTVGGLEKERTDGTETD